MRRRLRSPRAHSGTNAEDPGSSIISVIGPESKSRPVPFCSGRFRGRLSTDALYQRQASVVTEKVLHLS